MKQGIGKEANQILEQARNLGSCVFVTGGSSGTGATIARRFLRNQDTVIVLDKDSPGFLKDELGSLDFWRVDFSNIRELQDLPFHGVPKESAHSSITLINNVCARPRIGLHEETYDSWTSTLNVCLSSAFFLAQSLLELASQLGLPFRVCNVSSILSDRAGTHSPAYGVAKAGLENLTKFLAVKGREVGTVVKSVAVAPGMVVKDSNKDFYFSNNNEQYHRIIESAHPSQSYATESDVAELVYWMVSESPEFLNGQTLVFDGALTIQDPIDIALRASQLR